MEVKHDRSFCEDCLLPKRGKGCFAFIDRKNPILNEEGLCNARITSEYKYDRWIRSLERM